MKRSHLIAALLFGVSLLLAPFAFNRANFMVLTLFAFAVAGSELSTYYMRTVNGLVDLDTEYSRVQVFGSRDAESGRNLLKVAVHELRKVLGEHALRTTGDQLSLDTSIVACDLVEFESAATSDPQSDPTVQNTDTFYYWFGFQRSGDFVATDPWAVWIARDKGVMHGEQNSPNGCHPTVCNGPNVTQDTGNHYYAIERDSGATRYYRDGTLSYTATVTNTDLSPMVRNFTAASTVTVDYVRVTWDRS
jgi:hypothetical protein